MLIADQFWLLLIVIIYATSDWCSSALEFDFTQSNSIYHDLAEFEHFLRQAPIEFPSICNLLTIGASREGRKLQGLKIGAHSSFNGTQNQKQAIWIDGGNHGREWPAFHVALYFAHKPMDSKRWSGLKQALNKIPTSNSNSLFWPIFVASKKLLTGFRRDPAITNLLTTLDFYIFPILNPDGFAYSRTSTKDLIRQWRKNRRPPASNLSSSCNAIVRSRRSLTKKSKTTNNLCGCEGVDLNRNWPVAFSPFNYPYNDPCSDEYQGPYPFSEPENIALRDFLLSDEIAGKVHAMLSMHTHGQLFIIPYNYRRKTYPHDYADLERLAHRAANAITKKQPDIVYQVGTVADMLGPATGGAIDWVKMNTKIKYTFVVELPPTLATWFNFQMKARWLLPTCEGTWEAVRVIAEQVIAEFAEK